MKIEIKLIDENDKKDVLNNVHNTFIEQPKQRLVTFLRDTEHGPIFNYRLEEITEDKKNKKIEKLDTSKYFYVGPFNENRPKPYDIDVFKKINEIIDFINESKNEEWSRAINLILLTSKAGTNGRSNTRGQALQELLQALEVHAIFL